MAVIYDKIGYGVIEKGLKQHIDDEFMNVYISPKIKMMGTEFIRINLDSSSDIVSHHNFETRLYSVMVRYYLIGNTNDVRVNEAIKGKADRLRKHLSDKRTNGSDWADLTISAINYNVSDDENADNENLNIIEYIVEIINNNGFQTS